MLLIYSWGTWEKNASLLLQMLDTKKISSKEVEELRLAIDKDYVQQFWIGYQG
tara:strand:- start:162 stop:320 length:159 start_codon:yes stop_codon:yes gene_type:complete